MKTLHALLFAASSSSFAAGADGPLMPEQSLAAFKLEPGLRIELVAAEPLVIAPVCAAFDERGRLYVAEGRGYPDEIGGGRPAQGRIALLEDADGDGRHEKRSEFAEGLAFPCGVLPWRGGVFVACAPDVLYLKDTDGDGRADERRVVLTGFDAVNRSTQHFLNSPVLAPDGRVYLADGVGGVSSVTCPLHPARAAVQSQGHDWRFDPDTFEIEPVAGYGQFGMTLDDAGHRFVCYNRNPIRHVVLEARDLKRNPALAFSEVMQEVSKFGPEAKVWPLSPDTTAAGFLPGFIGRMHAGTMTSSCGVHIHRGTALSPAHDGNAFICEPAQNLVQRQLLASAGGTFTAAVAREGAEFLASADSWFRPVSTTTGPDGALYICDMYRRMIDHPDIFPPEVRAKLDFVSGKDRGRIYRVLAADQAKRSAAVRFDVADAASLCTALASPHGWTRDTAWRLLLERKDKRAIPLLRGLVKDDGHAATPALCLLDCLHALDDETLAAGLRHQHTSTRETAARLLRGRTMDSATLRTALFALADDPHPQVRFQCALALGDFDDARGIHALAKIAAQAMSDRWTRAAVFSSLRGREHDFLKAFLALAPAADAAMPAMMTDLSRLLGTCTPAERRAALLSDLTADDTAAWQPAALLGFAEGLRGAGVRGGLDAVAGEASAARVRGVFARAAGIATDLHAGTGVRLSAIALLGQSTREQAAAILLGLIRSGHLREIQSAAVRALAQIGEADEGRALVEHSRWRAYDPAVRESVLAALVSQPRMTAALLDAIEAKTISPLSIDPARRKQLLKHRNPQLSARAGLLFASLGGADRMKVFESLKTVLALTPDSNNGHAVFQRTCMVCHTHAGEGIAVGPDLTGVRNQPPEALLLHILVPSAEMQADFRAHEAQTKDGRILLGLLASQTDTSITLKMAGGVQESLLRVNLDTLGTTSLSLMPDGLENAMSKQELRDLIGFLTAPGQSDPAIKGQRIFTAGHSLHMFMPRILTHMAAAAKIDAHQQIGSQSVGGSPVSQQWNLPDERNQAKTALKAGSVDVLTLSPIYLPDEGIENFATLALAHNPNVRVTVQEFWIPYDDPKVLQAGAGPKIVARNDRTLDELRQMHAAYFQSMDAHIAALNAKLGKSVLSIVPVGQAVMALRGHIIAGTAPGLSTQDELFKDGLGHPRGAVQALTAYCHFAVIYRRSPIGLPVPEALADHREPSKLNTLLQHLSWDAVTAHPLSGVPAAKR